VRGRPERIGPQPRAEWSAATQEQLGAVVHTGVPRPVRLPAVIARHPTLLAPYLEWAKAVALRGVLSPRENALLALRTGFLWGSEFEWGVHAETAPVRAGLTDAELAAVAAGPDAATWTPRERALLQAADELVEHGTVGDATWAALAEHLDDAALVEAVLTVGHYSMLSMLANAAGVAPAPDWRPLPDAP
jgi:4-carboxymuconolactone decarboxylase